MKKQKPKINLIFLYANQTFLIWDPQIEPQAFRHTNCTLGKNVFLKCEEWSNSRFNLLQIGLWAFGSWILV